MNHDWIKTATVYDVFSWADERFRSGAFEEVNSLIDEMVVADLDSDTVLAFLTCSSWAADKIPVRPAFFQRAKALFIERGEEDIDGLLSGLEPDLEGEK